MMVTRKKSLFGNLTTVQKITAVATCITAVGAAYFFLKGESENYITSQVEKELTPILHQKFVDSIIASQKNKEDSTRRWWKDNQITRKMNFYDSVLQLEYPAIPVQPIHLKEQ
jgi:hypothetical protein